ncbi:MAG: hypothetical protein EP326_09220 [Deltaproteobacteria bacterium]|nr:MAG: hypothetical protein EP326_09220 [Deltaproteobacteria bacterium]TNF31092.1 MAG: hypothetical protein EP319_03200 [Deltaproteobacteria bacterium]
MQELFSLIRVYLFFGIYQFIAVALALAIFYKPKFIFQRNRWQEKEVEIPRWAKIAAILNLLFSSIFLGVFSYYFNLFNFKAFF